MTHVSHVFIHEWVPREIVLYMESKLANHFRMCPLIFSPAKSDFFPAGYGFEIMELEATVLFPLV